MRLGTLSWRTVLAGISSPLQTRQLEKRIRRREELGRYERPIFAVLGLRPPMALHTHSEAALIRKYAAHAVCAVEIGVAEGGSAYEIRRVIDPGGTLYLVDPFPPGLLFGVSMTRVVAGRVVARVDRGDVAWVRTYSHDAGSNWSRPIDFLLIDADHRFEAVRNDWELWTPHVRRGGVVAMHDALLPPGRPAIEGPARVLQSALAQSREWALVDGADSMAILKRVGS
jgi:predicted O-methyltransferase YrrM